MRGEEAPIQVGQMPKALLLNRARAARHRFPCRKCGACFPAEWDYGSVSYHYFPSVASECGSYWVSDGLRKREK